MPPFNPRFRREGESEQKYEKKGEYTYPRGTWEGRGFTHASGREYGQTEFPPRKQFKLSWEKLASSNERRLVLAKRECWNIK